MKRAMAHPPSDSADLLRAVEMVTKAAVCLSEIESQGFSSRV